MRVKVVKNTRSLKDDPEFALDPDRFIEYPLPLTVGNVYRVYGDSPNHYRVMDDFGEPILYEKELFEVVDATLPDDWVVSHIYEDGTTHGSQSCFAEPGFWEDYFDRKKYALLVVHKRLMKAVDTGE